MCVCVWHRNMPDANNPTANNSTAVRHTAATGWGGVTRTADLSTGRSQTTSTQQPGMLSCACMAWPPSAVLLHAVMLLTRDNALGISRNPRMQETLCAQARPVCCTAATSRARVPPVPPLCSKRSRLSPLLFRPRLSSTTTTTTQLDNRARAPKLTSWGCWRNTHGATHAWHAITQAARSEAYT